MEAFRHVLAALDLGKDGNRLTPGSRKAMARAAWVAQRVRAPLTLLHSDRADEYWDDARSGFVNSSGSRGGAREELEKARRESSEGGVETRVVVRPETAWLAIVQEVLSSGIDLVVAGKRTDIHSDDRKLGTVAHKLLRKAPCAVWLEDPRESGDPKVILAATDLTPVGDRAVELAASVAQAFAAELHVVHAYSLGLEAQMEGGSGRQEYEREKRRLAREQIETVLAGTTMATGAKLHIGLTSPSQAILDGVEQLRPGLVVMGTVSRGGIPGLLIGNTAERLIDRIDCSLLTVKPADFVCPVARPEAP